MPAHQHLIAEAPHGSLSIWERLSLGHRALSKNTNELKTRVSRVFRIDASTLASSREARMLRHALPGLASRERTTESSSPFLWTSVRDRRSLSFDGGDPPLCHCKDLIGGVAATCLFVCHAFLDSRKKLLPFRELVERGGREEDSSGLSVLGDHQRMCNPSQPVGGPGLEVAHGDHVLRILWVLRGPVADLPRLENRNVEHFPPHSSGAEL